MRLADRTEVVNCPNFNLTSRTPPSLVSESEYPSRHLSTALGNPDRQFLLWRCRLAWRGRGRGRDVPARLWANSPQSLDGPGFSGIRQRQHAAEPRWHCRTGLPAVPHLLRSLKRSPFLPPAWPKLPPGAKSPWPCLAAHSRRLCRPHSPGAHLRLPPCPRTMLPPSPSLPYRYARKQADIGRSVGLGNRPFSPAPLLQ